MITVWTQPGCGPCYAIKRALAGVPYVERDASDADADRLADWRARGWQTPIVEYPGGSFSGYLPDKVRMLASLRG
jgi:glutaredoxin